MSLEHRPVGSFAEWLWCRCVQALVILGWVSVPKTWSLFELLEALLLAYVSVLADPLAYGTADENGITFRKYIRRRFVSWQDVVTAEWSRWNPSLIKVTLKSGRLWKRALYFSLNSSLKSTVQQLLGRSTPEIVLWIARRIRAEASQGDY